MAETPREITLIRRYMIATLLTPVVAILAIPLVAALKHRSTVDPPLPMSVRTAKATALAAPTGPSVGANLAGLSMGYLAPYADLMKTAGPWQGDPVNHGAYTFDSNGWLVFSAWPTNPDTKALQAISYVRSCQTIPGNDRGAPCCPSGAYTLVYTPNAVCPAGAITLQSATASFTVSAGKSTTLPDGHVQVTYACAWTPNPQYTGAAFMTVVQGSKLGAMPTDVRIYGPGIDPAHPPEFDPGYLKQLAPFRAIRTVVIWDLGGWTRPEDTPTAATRSYATIEGRTGIAGMPVDSFVRLVTAAGTPGNPCGVDLCIPWNATDALVASLGTTCKALPAGTDLRVEYGNEGWNAANGPQWNHLVTVGQSGPPYPDQSPTYAHPGDAFSGVCIESTRVWALFAQAYGKPFLKVLSSQQGSPQPCINHMQTILSQNLTRPDRWAVSWYVPTSVPYKTPGPYTLTQIQAAQTAAARAVADGFKVHRQWLDGFSLDGKTVPFAGTPLEGYEGGFTHCYLTQTLSGQQSRENLAAIFHPAMQGMTTTVLTACADPALKVDRLQWYASDYVIPIEAGVYPLYALYLGPNQRPAANDGTDGSPDLSTVLNLATPDASGSLVGQVPLDTCGSPAALAILKWSLARDVKPPPVPVTPDLPPTPTPPPPPVPTDPLAASRAQAHQSIDQLYDALNSALRTQGATP